MNPLRFGAYAAGFILAIALVIAITLPDFVTPAVAGLLEVFR